MTIIEAASSTFAIAFSFKEATLTSPSLAIVPVQSERIGVRLVLGVEVRVLPVHVRRIVRDRERGCVARRVLFCEFRARNIDAVRCAEQVVRIGHKADDRKRRIMAFERLRAAADEEGRGRGIARLIALPERARPNDRIGRNRDGAAVDWAGLGRRRAVGRIAHGAALRHLDRNALRGGIYARGRRKLRFFRIPDHAAAVRCARRRGRVIHELAVRASVGDVRVRAAQQELIDQRTVRGEQKDRVTLGGDRKVRL